MKLAENINTYLMEQGIKKKYVAEKSNISENALNLALNGKRRLLADEYVRICQTLDVPFDRFVGQQFVGTPSVEGTRSKRQNGGT